MCIVEDAGGSVIVSPATSASSMLSTATKGMQGFGDDYSSSENTFKSRSAPRTTFGYVGSQPDDPGAITWFPEESKSATPPPEESKLPDVEPRGAAEAIKPPADSKSKLLASLMATDQQSVEQTADSGSRPTGAHRTTSSSATEQHDKESGRRTLQRQMPSSPTYGGPSPSSASTSSSLVAAGTATISPTIEAEDVDSAVGVGEGRGEVTVPVNRPVRFGVLPEGEPRGGGGNHFVRGTNGPRMKR